MPAATNTSLAATTALETPIPSRRLGRRGLSTSHVNRLNINSACQHFPPSIEALDLSFESPTVILAALRLHILSYLADLETRLSSLESPICSQNSRSWEEDTAAEARAWAQTALEMLKRIRADVCSHLPELHFESVPSVEKFVQSHIPDVPRLDEVRAHLPDMPDVVRSHLPDLDLSDVRSRLDDVRSRISDIDFRKPLDYIPTLSEHLHSLQNHLSAVDLPKSLSQSIALLTPTSTLSELLSKLLASDIVSEISHDLQEGEDMLEKAAVEIATAMKRSLDGARLIRYADLPDKWRNNPFVSSGYRFIPGHKWPLLILSLFALHNETVNIHTHLVPFVVWSLNLMPNPLSSSSALHAAPSDLPVLAFRIFALVCLFTSALWHTMTGCAHSKSMELCARVDYVGIVWLINGSIGTVVYYGFQEYPDLRNLYLGVCVLLGVFGTALPFMDWFNRPQFRNFRIAFFVLMACSAVAPLAQLANLYSTVRMFAFISPIVPSLMAYAVGVVVYALRIPECFVACPGDHHWLDRLGGGSHAIWHVCIVAAISIHWRAMSDMKAGLGAPELAASI